MNLPGRGRGHVVYTYIEAAGRSNRGFRTRGSEERQREVRVASAWLSPRLIRTGSKSVSLPIYFPVGDGCIEGEKNECVATQLRL